MAFDEGETPVSLDFVDDCKALLVGTSIKNQMKFELPDMKKKNLAHEMEKINCSIYGLMYPI